MRKYQEVEESIKPYLQELNDVWERLTQGYSFEYKLAQVGYFKSGKLDIREFVKKYPNLSSGELETVRVMTQNRIDSVEVKRPERIRVRLIADCSGSMSEGRRKVLRQAYVLFTSSLFEFSAMLNSARSNGNIGSDIAVTTQVITFGSYAQEIKPLRTDSSVGGFQAERASAIRAFPALSVSMNSTSGDSALDLITNSITDADKRAIASKKTLDLAFYITDGGADSEERLAQAVKDLSATGVTVVALQIGTTDAVEQRIFRNVFKEKGEVIGADISRLVPQLVKLLKGKLSAESLSVEK